MWAVSVVAAGNVRAKAVAEGAFAVYADAASVLLLYTVQCTVL